MKLMLALALSALASIGANGQTPNTEINDTETAIETTLQTMPEYGIIKGHSEKLEKAALSIATAARDLQSQLSLKPSKRDTTVVGIALRNYSEALKDLEDSRADDFGEITQFRLELGLALAKGNITRGAYNAGIRFADRAARAMAYHPSKEYAATFDKGVRSFGGLPDVPKAYQAFLEGFTFFEFRPRVD